MLTNKNMKIIFLVLNNSEGMYLYVLQYTWKYLYLYFDLAFLIKMTVFTIECIVIFVIFRNIENRSWNKSSMEILSIWNYLYLFVEMLYVSSVLGKIEIVYKP